MDNNNGNIDNKIAKVRFMSLVPVEVIMPNDGTDNIEDIENNH